MVSPSVINPPVDNNLCAEYFLQGELPEKLISNFLAIKEMKSIPRTVFIFWNK